MATTETELLQALVARSAGADGGIFSSPLGNSEISANSRDSELTSLQKLVRMFSGVGGGVVVQPPPLLSGTALPTEDPKTVGALWNNGGFVCVSQG